MAEIRKVTPVLRGHQACRSTRMRTWPFCGAKATVMQSSLSEVVWLSFQDLPREREETVLYASTCKTVNGMRSRSEKLNLFSDHESRLYC